jgi:general secretion pathway protein G
MMNQYRKNKGLSLIELVACTVIIGILASTALPISKNYVLRKKEEVLRENLREIRKSIDYYRDRKLATGMTLPEEELYPESLMELVETKCLRRIPLDPFTAKPDWKTRSTTDDHDSFDSDMRNVYDVYSSTDLLDKQGIPYSEW